MQAINDALFGATGSAHLQFLVFAFLGGCVAWLIARPRSWSCWLSTLLVVGASGAWLGAEAACLLARADRGGGAQIVGALLGALALAYAWRGLHPRPEADHGGVAIHPPHA